MLTTIKKDELSLMIEQSVRKVFNESIVKKPPVDPNDYIGIEEAAKIVRKSPSRVYTLCSEKKIPHYKKGNGSYFIREELLEWVKKGKVKTVDEVAQEANAYVAQSFRSYGKK